MKRTGPLKRKKPMQRTPFRRHVVMIGPSLVAELLDDGETAGAARIEPGNLAPFVGTVRWGSFGPAELTPAPKRDYVRSEALLEEVRRIRVCQSCRVHGPVDPAHSNWSVHGKGGHIKADDHRIAALCRACHDAIDAGNVLSDVERQVRWWKAHVRTIRHLLYCRKWPASVPIPDLTWPPEWGTEHDHDERR